MVMLSATTTFNVNGDAKSVVTNVSIDDIDAHGIAWCEPARQLAPGVDPLLDLGTFINLATICRTEGRDTDELAALRSARRVGIMSTAEIDVLIAEKCAGGPAAKIEPAEYSIVSYAAQPEEFTRLLDGELVSENVYYSGFPYEQVMKSPGVPFVPLDPKIDNISFHVCRSGKRLATLPLAVRNDQIARWLPLVTNYGALPARIHFADACNDTAKTIGLILDHLFSLMGSYGIKEAVIQEPFPQQMQLYKILSRDQLFSAELFDRPVVDLNRSDEQIFSDVRSSYKSLINWCRSNLSMSYYSGTELDDGRVREVYLTIQRCHQKVIERRGDNMTPDSFHLAIEMCKQGRGEVAIAKTSDGAPCGISVSTDSFGSSYYALGGQIQIGNRSPGNFTMFDASLRAKARGMQRYHPNALSPAAVIREGSSIRVRQRWQMANFFYKRGFSSDLDFVNVYRILPPTATVFPEY